MPFDLSLYPSDWKSRRLELLAQANNCCESCGVRQGDLRENTRNGDLYKVYLSIAHKNQYETWKEEAETMVLCQRCHRRYDRQFLRRAGTRYNSPIGYASVYIEHQGRKVLVHMSRTFDELRDVMAALPCPASIEIQLIVLLFAVVGNGHYRKETTGTLTLIHEFGACAGLYPQIQYVCTPHH
jgi:hypothetical protein